MLSLSKKLAKFENYWLEDCCFRNLVRAGCYSCCSRNFLQYSDLTFSYNDFYNLRGGLLNIESNSGRNKLDTFGCKLGLQGKIEQVREMLNWTIESNWKGKEDELEKQLSILGLEYSSFFFFGLRGQKFSKERYLFSAIILNRAGYDYYFLKTGK
jgi:hypothetical protein